MSRLPNSCGQAACRPRLLSLRPRSPSHCPKRNSPDDTEHWAPPKSWFVRDARVSIPNMLLREKPICVVHSQCSVHVEPLPIASAWELRVSTWRTASCRHWIAPSPGERTFRHALSKMAFATTERGFSPPCMPTPRPWLTLQLCAHHPDCVEALPLPEPIPSTPCCW